MRTTPTTDGSIFEHKGIFSAVDSRGNLVTAVKAAADALTARAS
jgi:hypothetical protein